MFIIQGSSQGSGREILLRLEIVVGLSKTGKPVGGLVVKNFGK